MGLSNTKGPLTAVTNPREMVGAAIGINIQSSSPPEKRDTRSPFLSQEVARTNSKPTSKSSTSGIRKSRPGIPVGRMSLREAKKMARSKALHAHRALAASAKIDSSRGERGKRNHEGSKQSVGASDSRISTHSMNSNSAELGQMLGFVPKPVKKPLLDSRQSGVQSGLK